MEQFSFAAVFDWVIRHGYFFIFIAMCVEGPVVTAAAAFAAALGKFSWPVIFILAIFGDLVPDSLYYAVGYAGRLAAVRWWGKKLHAPGARLKHVEAHLARHAVKTIVALKLTPLIAVPGFMTVGASHYSFRKYLGVCFLVTLPKVIIFASLGFFLGSFLRLHGEYVERIELTLSVAVLFTIGLVIGINKIAARLARKFESI